MGSGVVSAMTPNSEPLLGVEHAACIEFDDDAEHIVVLQQVGELLQRLQKPGKDERIGAQARVNSEHAVRGRSPLLVIDDKTQYLSVRAGAGAALDWRCAVGPRFENVKPAS